MADNPRLNFIRRDPGVQSRETWDRLKGANRFLTDLPENMAKSIYSGLTLPGDVMAGKADPYDYGRVLDTAGLLTLGSAAIPKGSVGTELRAGISRGGGKKINEAGRNILAKQPGAAKSAAKMPRQEAITAKSLRDIPPDEALATAKTERHIIPKKEGGFVGAPYSAKTRADIDMIREKFDADVAAGAAGADWYPRAQEWIKQVAGKDPARQSELARNLALFSAQADPKGNLGFSIKARNNAIMDMTPTSAEGKEGVVRTGQQWDTYKQAYDANAGMPALMGHNGGPSMLEEIKLGPKTGIYSDHMDPTKTNPNTGTNDIWHARALGYTTPEGTPWESALTPQQHSFMDAETILAMDRANQSGLAGRTDWTPGEIQAAPWVAGKGRGLETSRNMTPEQGLAEASKTYPDYAQDFTAYGTHEIIPGKTTGHLPGAAYGDQATRDAYSDKGIWWRGDDGRDILYDAQGAYTQPTRDTVGIFGDEFNQGQAAQPMISHSGPSGQRVVDPASRQMMTGTEGFRAMMDAQDAGAWSSLIPGQKAGHSNAFELNRPDMQSRDGLAQIITQGQGLDTGFTGNLGGGRNVITNPFGDEGVKTGIPTAQKKAIQGAYPGAEPVRMEGDYIGLEDAWQKGQGSEAVTKQMLAGLNPAQEAALSSPQVKAQVLAKFDRDADFAARSGQPLRQDLQMARKLFADGGMPALREALGKGILPAAAGAAIMPYLTGGGGTDESGGGGWL